MENNFEEREKLYSSLIQNTPFVDDLIVAVARSFTNVSDETRDSFLEVVGGGRSRHQKCRRFYDWLLNEYSHTQLFKSLEHQQQFWKIFHNSGNSAALETIQLMMTLKTGQVDQFRDNIDLEPETGRSNRTITPKRTQLDHVERRIYFFANNIVADGVEDESNFQRFDFVVACRAARVGDVEALKVQLNCCASHDLKPITESDWGSKTLLHNAVDQGLRHPNQLLCIDLLLDFANRRGRKNKFLDAQDSLNGETALHLAVKGESVVFCRKLIQEGADILIRNRNGKSCLDLLYEKLPQVVVFLLDKAIAASGDTTGDLFKLSIDFGVVVGYYENAITEEDNNGRRTGNLMERRRRRSQEHQSSEIFPLTLLPTTKQVTTSGVGGSRTRKCLASTKIMNVAIDESTNAEGLNQSNTNHSKETNEKERSKYPIVDKSMYKMEESEHKYLIKQTGEMGALAKLVYTNTQSFSVILSHPVVQTFLDEKWKKMANYFRLSTFFQIAFCILYTFAMYDIYVWTCPHSIKICEWTEVDISTVICMSVANVIFLLKEIFEAKRISDIETVKIYFEGSENCIQLLFVMVNFSTTIPIYFQNSFHHLQYGLATFGILLASVVIVMVIGNSNQTFILHSAYVHVYGVIIKRFLTVLLTFSAIIIAFAISFSVICTKPILSFTTYAGTISKMFMMLAGEFNFDNIVTNNNNSDNNNGFLSTDTINNQHQLVLVAFLLYVLFATFLTIVLIDVFLGYTISDIQELKKSAEKIRRSIQVEQLYIMEGFLESLKYYCSCCFSFIDIRVVISKRKPVHLDYVRYEMINNAVLLPFKDLHPQIRMEFRKILNKGES